MHDERTGQIAVIFTSRRNDEDADGYHRAAATMAALAAVQPGYRGVDSARGEDGVGITVSDWADEASAVAWRQHAEHSLIREHGRERWYDCYAVSVARVERSYAWQRPASPLIDEAGRS